MPRILKVNVDSLALDLKNARRHDDRNIEAIRRSLEAFGQVRPILISPDKLVIAGNGTVVAARQLGWATVDAIRSELTPDMQAAYALADNRTAELASWDDDALAESLAAIRATDVDATLTGFTGDEIDKYIVTGGEAGKVEPEMPFTVELMESSNYVVFVFDNDFDWSVIVEAFGIETVKALDARPGYVRTGVGRVVDGAKLVEKLGIDG